MSNKSNSQSEWPKAPTRIDERADSVRKLRKARELVAHIIAPERKAKGKRH
jgi:hypothetical protein